MTTPLLRETTARPSIGQKVPRKFPWGLLLLALAIVTIVIPVVHPFNDYWMGLLRQASTQAIAVMGMVVVLGYAGQINLAQAAFFGIGAYSLGLGTLTLGLPWGVALLLGTLLAAVAGAALGSSTLRLGGHYLAMVTISFQQILTLVLINWISLTRGPDGVSGIPRPSILGLDFKSNGDYLALCLVVLYATGYLVWRLKRTRLGRGMLAVRDNELAAGVVGIDTYRTKVIAFALSSALGGIGGGLFASGYAYISPDQFSFGESVVVLTMALLGGVQSPFGAVLGTGLLILLPEWLRFLKLIYLAVYGAAVILIMVFMPEGIWGALTERVRRMRPPPRIVEGDVPFELGGTPDTGRMAMLEVTNLCKYFGGLKALDGISMAVERGTVHALIGPNGSGKTTTLNLLSGIYRPTAGEIRLDGKQVAGLPPHLLAGAGLGRTFQNIRLFTSMTVLENVEIGGQRPNLVIPGGDAGLRHRALGALSFVGLVDRAGLPVQSLSYGHQRLVEIARALAGNPALLLLDEPAAGLNLTEKQELVELLRRIKAHGLTILLIDHDMNLVEQIADRITVLNFGRRIADGTPQEVLRHPDVIAAYLGEVTDDAAA
ncbi:MAG TPA: branched-chain amino acid ABC transporter ATP-binding protein/permease [Stellaceae bacterium]|nr:branched-chain amino acid ABC transporter ATP-binding protein/permease [Stellaceae bacterium]